MKLFFSATYGSISGIYLLIYLSGYVAYTAEPPPVSKNAFLSAIFFINWKQKEVMQSQIRRMGRIVH
jgi:hypothetical protein